VPPALLPLLAAGQQIVVLEPRRLAARAAASRVAQELGCELGGLVGYQVRGDARCGKATRIRFVTEGVLVRQLVHDPFLDGVGAVCLDEFHERHLEGDLALAMLSEARNTVRPDLRLCVMSATLDPAPLRAFLPDAAQLEADGRLFPVEVVHLARRSDDPLEVTVRTAIERALEETAGDVLVFLPGVGEIQRCEGALDNLARRLGVLVLPLHGRLDPAEQDRAIRPQRQRKVVLSTNVAESSLTIAGVTAVVDSGLARELRFDRGRGVDVLELERISLASATQRAGRAGRTGPGRCYRLWSLAEERGMAPQTRPEVQRIDLCGPALLVRAFAGRDPREFGWYEAPPPDALHAADDLLVLLGALDPRSKALTARGQQLLELPLHPRLGAVVLAGRELGGAVAAATAATLLSDVDRLGRDDGADLGAATDAFLLAEERGFPEGLCREFGSWPGQARQLRASRDRLLDRRRDRDAAAAREELRIAWSGPAAMPSLSFADQDSAEGVLILHHFGLELAAAGCTSAGPLLLPPALRRGGAAPVLGMFTHAVARVRTLLIEYNSYLSGGIPFVFPGGDPVLCARGATRYRYPRLAEVDVDAREDGIRIHFAAGELGAVTSSGFYVPTRLVGDVDVAIRYVVPQFSAGPDATCLGLFLQNEASTARYYAQLMSTSDAPAARSVALGHAGAVIGRRPVSGDTGWLRLLRRGGEVIAFFRADTQAPWQELGRVPATADELVVGAKIWSKQRTDGLIGDLFDLSIDAALAADQPPVLESRPDPRVEARKR
ncbi:MAG: ATP-dependent RNA helicase, partial [Planctomycetes bacterium]|nr:ATP-dependent RNA helicase [Planctomycetota bacterium]